MKKFLKYIGVFSLLFAMSSCDIESILQRFDGVNLSDIGEIVFEEFEEPIYDDEVNGGNKDEENPEIPGISNSEVFEKLSPKIQVEIDNIVGGIDAYLSTFYLPKQIVLDYEGQVFSYNVSWNIINCSDQFRQSLSISETSDGFNYYIDTSSLNLNSTYGYSVYFYCYDGEYNSISGEIYKEFIYEGIPSQDYSEFANQLIYQYEMQNFRINNVTYLPAYYTYYDSSLGGYTDTYVEYTVNTYGYEHWFNAYYNGPEFVIEVFPEAGTFEININLNYYAGGSNYGAGFTVIYEPNRSTIYSNYLNQITNYFAERNYMISSSITIPYGYELYISEYGRYANINFNILSGGVYISHQTNCETKFEIDPYFTNSYAQIEIIIFDEYGNGYSNFLEVKCDSGNYYFVGTQNGWSFMDEYRLTKATYNEWIYETTVYLPANSEFKVAGNNWSCEYNAFMMNYNSGVTNSKNDASSICTIYEGNYYIWIDVSNNTINIEYRG